MVRLVDVNTGEIVQEVDHGAPTTAVAISVGTRLLATGGVDRIVRIWRASTGLPLVSLKGHVGPISAVSFSARGTLIATASTDGIGRVWRTSGGSPVSVISGHANYLTDIAFSPDGTQVVTASLDRTARTWKAETGAALATFAGETDAVVSARFAGFGLEVVTASRDGSARVWDAVVQPRLPVVTDLGAPVTRVDFAVGGRSVTATAGGRAYRIGLPRGPAVPIGPAVPSPTTVSGPGGAAATVQGNTVTVTRPDGKEIELVGHRAEINSVAFSADGTQVVTASADHDARIWDARSGAMVQVLLGHFATVSDARFSPDGRWVVTAGPETAGLWSAKNGRLIYLLRGHEGKLLSVAFSSDGRRIVTGGLDGTVRLYRCTICGGVDELVDLASARLEQTGRVPTDGERRRYGL
jgi:WD40 repeat protein